MRCPCLERGASMMSFCELVDGRLCGWSVIHALHTSLKGGVHCCCTSLHIQIQLLLPRFGGLQTQPAHSACTTTTRQEGAKEIGCLQAETRQQEASICQRSLQPFRCTGTQFRGNHSLFSNGFPKTSISQTPRLV